MIPRAAVALAASALAACGSPEGIPEPSPPSPPTPVAPAAPAPPADAPSEAAAEVSLELRQEPAFDAVVAVPPRSEALEDPPPGARVWMDPETGWLLSFERRGEGTLHPAPTLSRVAERAAQRQGAAGEVDLFDGAMGDVAAVHVDFAADAAITATCVAWRNGSLYLFSVSDPGGGPGVSELARLLCSAVTFTTPVQPPPPPKEDPLAGLGVVLPGAASLAVQVDGPNARLTDVAEGYVTVLAGFPLDESPYAGLRGLALAGRLEGEGCTVRGSDEHPVASRPARRFRCVLGADGPRQEYALLSVVAGDAREWVVSVVAAEEDWPAAEAYAGRLFEGATLP